MDRFLIVAWFSLYVADIKALPSNCMYIDYRGWKGNNNISNCHGNNVCNKTFKISYVHIPPYSTADLLIKIIKKCCGECSSITVDNIFLNITEVSIAAFNTSDFILPFLARSSAIDLYGYKFIPLIDVPNAFYLTPQRKSIVQNLIYKCLNLYPLIVMCLLMAVISGFIVWGIETWYQEEQFPRAFLSGVFEGFWYSFISMTTVGYGDRVVTSFPARIFSVVWILIGVIMFGLLTSLFTTELINAMQPQSHSMRGSLVGVLKFRDFDGSLVVKEGGIIKESSSWNFFSDILMLIRMLKNGKIDGVLLDKYTLAYTNEYLDWKKSNVDYFLSENKSNGETYEEKKDDIHFFHYFTHRTLKVHDGEKLTYGVLVKNMEDYVFFRDAIRDNRLPMETAVGSTMNNLFKKYKNLDATSISGYFIYAVKGITIVIGGIFVFGFLYEMYNRKWFCKEDVKHQTISNDVKTASLGCSL